MINKIKNDNIREIISDILDLYSDDIKREYSEKLAFWCYKLLINKGMINEENVTAQQVFSDIIIGAALISNIFCDNRTIDYHFYDVFRAREILDPYLIDKGMPDDYRNALFQTIEGQMGNSFPVPFVRPTSDSPSGILAEAKFIVDTIIANNINYGYKD